MKDSFVSPDNPILVKIAEEVVMEGESFHEAKSIIDRMLHIAYGEQKERNKPVLVGLAAPQIGISKRIILVDVAANGKGTVGDLRVYINPEITFHSEETSEWYEGCFSTDRVCGIVDRPIKISVSAITQDGSRVEENHEGYTARIFQHEIDHLNGKEFITHITDDEKLHWVENDEFPQYRNNEGWRTWKNKCSRNQWEKIKGIVNKTYGLRKLCFA